MTCIDAHAHLAVRPGATERLLLSMDKHHISRAFVVGGGLMDPRELAHRLHGAVPAPTEISFDNDALRAACRNHQRRLLPFYFANPWAGSVEYQEIGGEFYGLKLAPGPVKSF